MWYNNITSYEPRHEKTNVLHMQKTAKLISGFVFATWILQYLFFLDTKFQASSHLQYLYSLVCVRLVKIHSWFSHGAAHIKLHLLMFSHFLVWFFLCNKALASYIFWKQPQDFFFIDILDIKINQTLNIKETKSYFLMFCQHLWIKIQNIKLIKL